MLLQEMALSAEEALASLLPPVVELLRPGVQEFASASDPLSRCVGRSGVQVLVYVVK